MLRGRLRIAVAFLSERVRCANSIFAANGPLETIDPSFCTLRLPILRAIVGSLPRRHDVSNFKPGRSRQAGRMTTVDSFPQPEGLVPSRERSGRGPWEPPVAVPVGVILAAGSSSRLGGVPKPLVRVAGVTLLERAVSTLRSAGVERIVVVGHARADVREFVAREGLDVELVENDDFALGNGSSLLVGGRAAAARFLVAMV